MYKARRKISSQCIQECGVKGALIKTFLCARAIGPRAKIRFHESLYTVGCIAVVFPRAVNVFFYHGTGRRVWQLPGRRLTFSCIMVQGNKHDDSNDRTRGPVDEARRVLEHTRSNTETLDDIVVYARVFENPTDGFVDPECARGRQKVP